MRLAEEKVRLAGVKARESIVIKKLASQFKMIFLPNLEKLYHRPEKGLQYHGILQLRVVPATGAEKFAEFIFNKLNPFVKEETNNRVKVKQVEFREHGKNSAIYSE